MRNGYFIVYANIFNDTRGRFLDSAEIYTSNIVSGELKEGCIITTLNSTYLLGKERMIPTSYQS